MYGSLYSQHSTASDFGILLMADGITDSLGLLSDSVIEI